MERDIVPGVGPFNFFEMDRIDFFLAIAINDPCYSSFNFFVSHFN